MRVRVGCSWRWWGSESSHTRFDECTAGHATPVLELREKEKENKVGQGELELEFVENAKDFRIYVIPE